MSSDAEFLCSARSALMKVSASVADIICIAQITSKMVNNTLLINN